MLVKAKSLVGKTYEIPGIEPNESIQALKARIFDQILAKGSFSSAKSNQNEREVHFFNFVQKTVLLRSRIDSSTSG